jgi:hypothetical protein
MVSERLKTLIGKVKKELGERLSEIKPEDIAKFTAKEAVNFIPIAGPIIKDAFDEFSPDENEELLKEFKELSESQFSDISEKMGISVEYLKDIQKITLYTSKTLQADHEVIKGLILHLIKIQKREAKQIEKSSEKIEIGTRRINIQFFERIEEKIKDKTFPTREDFNNGLVYLDEQRKEKIEDLLESGKNCLLYGAPDSGKSTFALALGDYLFKEKGYLVFYLSKIRGGSWRDWYAEVKSNANEKTLFIIDDCHNLQEDLVLFIAHVKDVKGPKFLFVSRTTVKEMFEEKDLPFKIVEVTIKADFKAFSGIIERYCSYRHIENFEEKTVDFNEVIKNCGNNLLMLKQSLDSWDPDKEKLSDVRREKIYDIVYKDYLERDRDLFHACSDKRLTSQLLTHFI